ncbi:hypothetical protein PsorP6_011689 [Peronosclerospora sorghi]|uniref:Uncharacterized protein n=1 Tax=Peronosclerospora sorghi TaxID=230839 RepID=A0ACC0WML1_9STRA|nr:hypothetical protein PsorP6_011689 [Peronosclerospora sorghi]
MKDPYSGSDSSKRNALEMFKHSGDTISGNSLPWDYNPNFRRMAMDGTHTPASTSQGQFVIAKVQ